jgi:hypothetical protein
MVGEGLRSYLEAGSLTIGGESGCLGDVNGHDMLGRNGFVQSNARAA